MAKVPAKKRIPKMPIRIDPSQRKALERIAKQRGVTASALIRDQIAVLTGVPDPLPRKGRKGANEQFKKLAKT